MEEIRDIARRKPFDNPRTHQFCKQYQVTDQKALKILLEALEDKDLELEDPDYDGQRMVRKLERSEFS